MAKTGKCENYRPPRACHVGEGDWRSCATWGTSFTVRTSRTGSGCALRFGGSLPTSFTGRASRPGSDATCVVQRGQRPGGRGTSTIPSPERARQYKRFHGRVIVAPFQGWCAVAGFRSHGKRHMRQMRAVRAQSNSAGKRSSVSKQPGSLGRITRQRKPAGGKRGSCARSSGCAEAAKIQRGPTGLTSCRAASTKLLPKTASTVRRRLADHGPSSPMNSMTAMPSGDNRSPRARSASTVNR